MTEFVIDKHLDDWEIIRVNKMFQMVRSVGFHVFDFRPIFDKYHNKMRIFMYYHKL